MQHQFQIFSATPYIQLNALSLSRRLSSPLFWICIIFPTISFRFHGDNSRCFATLLSPPLLLSPQRPCLSAIFTYEQAVTLPRTLLFHIPLNFSFSLTLFSSPLLFLSLTQNSNADKIYTPIGISGVQL